ncbi:hypothetical protein V6Z12_A09G107200 [Gossypium hirsutum]
MSQMQSQPTQLKQQLGLQKQPNQVQQNMQQTLQASGQNQIPCFNCINHRVVSKTSSIPPTNAFLLMHCGSTPTKSWLEESNRVEKDEEEIMGVNKI